MNIAVLDDYQAAVETLDCFSRLAGHEVTVYRDSVTGIEALAARLEDVEAVVLIRERTPMPRELLERLPALRLIAQTGRGIPHIDLDACTDLGIAVTTGEGSPVAPAELTWALVLAAARYVPAAVVATRNGMWQTTLGRELAGTTLGIYGYGAIGARVALYGGAFGMHVVVTGREGSLERAATDGLETVDRATLFRDADVVSLHLKLTDETRGIVTAADLAAMKPTALLVNTARAALVARGALADALRLGRPGFAAVDVFDEEPVPGDEPLLRLENAVAAPHLGYVTRESYELYFGQAFDQVNAFAAGAPVGVVNPEALS